MPDICMCANGRYCSKSNSCYRYMATPDMWQTIADFYEPDKECEYYWRMRDATEVQTDDKEL